jgi:hypothetical protein
MAKDFTMKTLNITGTVCFLNLPSGKERNPAANPSKRNLGNIKLASFIYLNLFHRGWQAKDIGIATPYTAQAQQYMAPHHNMVQYLATYDKNPNLTEKMREQANKVHETALQAMLTTVTLFVTAMTNMTILPSPHLID